MAATRARAIVALGANLGDPRASFAAALAAIERELGPILARSSFIETAPLVLPGDDPARHPPYLNGAVLVGVTEPPLAALAMLHRIEQALAVATRNDVGTDARFSVVFDARSVRR